MQDEKTLTRSAAAYHEDPDSSPVYSMSAIMEIIDKEHQQFRNSEVSFVKAIWSKQFDNGIQKMGSAGIQLWSLRIFSTQPAAKRP